MKFLRYEYVTSENLSLLNFEIFIFPNSTNIFRFEHVVQFILEKVYSRNLYTPLTLQWIWPNRHANREPSSYGTPAELETQILANHIPRCFQQRGRPRGRRGKKEGSKRNAAITIGANSARDAIRSDRNRADSKRGDRMILTNLGKNVQTPFELVANWLRIDN